MKKTAAFGNSREANWKAMLSENGYTRRVEA
jgi:hypothetical protein